MNMFASVLHLDRIAVKALRVTDPYSLHRVVYSLYPDVRNDIEKSSSESSGILYADQGGDHNVRRILMLSNRRPADSVNGVHVLVKSKTIPQGFLDHSDYQFKVIVNPTRRDSASRKLLPVKGREGIAEWFVERALNSWGFLVPSALLQIDKVEVLQFKDKNQRQLTIAQAHLQGKLTITDTNLFHGSFIQGIGRGRAYGCGLLQIVPILNNPFA